MATFVYIDETGTTSLTDQEQPILAIVGVLVRESQIQALTESLGTLAMSALGWRPADFEFHGSEVFHGTGYWTPLSPPERVDAYRRVLALLGYHDIRIAHASINKPKLQAQYPNPDSPYLLALQFLCEKVHRLWPEQLKVLVADESKEHELRAIDMVADLQRWGTGVVPGPRLTSIIDSLHFVRSEASPGVQLADMVAFILQRHRRGTEKHPDAEQAVAELMTVIRKARITWREEWPS